MHLALNAVLEFHKKMGQTIGDPRKPNIEQEQEFRMELIHEELTELEEALAAGNTVKAADGIADLIYVLTGAAVTWGIDIASVFDEVHRSNMTKKPGNKRSDGKILKDADFSPANIQGVLDECANEFDEEWWEKPTVFSPANKSPEPIKCERKRCNNVTTTGLCAECASGPYFEPPEHISQNLMMAAKDQAKILAMKDIKADLVDENYPLQEAKAWDQSDGIPKAVKGEMTAWGAYVVECVDCERKHAINTRLGSRGGLANSGSCECICGKAYTVDFTTKEPTVTLTTIEDLRKAK